MEKNIFEEPSLSVYPLSEVDLEKSKVSGWGGGIETDFVIKPPSVNQ